MFEFIKKLKELFVCSHEWQLKDTLTHFKKGTLLGYTFVCIKCAKVKVQRLNEN